MQVKIALSAVLALVAVVPMAGEATEHCASQIYLFSYVSTPADDPLDPERRLGSPTVVSSAVGCLVIAEDFPETPGDDSDTDYIYPGSDTLVARWLEGGIPASGTIEFAGETYPLTFRETTNGLGPVTDSQQITIDPADSITGGDARVTVCRDAEGTNCSTRVYRTIG